MSKGWQIAGLIAALVVIPGSIYAAISVSLLTKITASIYSFKIRDFHITQIFFDLTIQVYNPARIKVEVSGIELDVFIDGVLIANIKDETKKVIAAQGSSFITLPIKITPEKFIKGTDWKNLITKYLTGKSNEIILSVDGKVKGELFAIPIRSKVKITKNLKELIEKKA